MNRRCRRRYTIPQRQAEGRSSATFSPVSLMRIGWIIRRRDNLMTAVGYEDTLRWMLGVEDD